MTKADLEHPTHPSEPPGDTRLSASEIHENVRVAADDELHRPLSELIWSSLAAGLTISFSFFAAGFLSTLAEEPLKTALAAAGYPLGFIFVVLGRQQLFTENTLEPVIPLLNDRSAEKLIRMLRLWLVVLAGNLVGALLIGWTASRTIMLEAKVQSALTALATKSVLGGFWTVGYQAIFAGWLVAMMAWLVASTRATGSQIMLIWLSTAPIAALNFRHSIAGAVEAFYLASSGLATWSSMITEFIVPAVLGNVIGGVLLVALLNYAQAGD